MKRNQRLTLLAVVLVTSLTTALAQSKPPLPEKLYSGANGLFTLYEDEGVNYSYERGAFTKIPIQWHEATRTLTIGKREGTFPGMLTERTFNIVFISQAKPVDSLLHQPPTVPFVIKALRFMCAFNFRSKVRLRLCSFL